MTDAEGLVIEECRRCVQDPNSCESSEVYKTASGLSMFIQKHGFYYDTRGMTCYEIVAFLEGVMKRNGIAAPDEACGWMSEPQPDPINTMPPEVKEEYGGARFKVTLFVEEMNEDMAKSHMAFVLEKGGADRPDAFTIEEAVA